MKIQHLSLLFYLMFLSLIGFSQTIIKDVPLTHEQVVVNDKIIFTITGMQIVDSIDVFRNIIKAGKGNKLVVVKLSYTGKISTKFILKPNDFIAMYGDIAIYMVPSICVGSKGTWITNEFEEKLGLMKITIDVTPDLTKNDLDVLFKLPETISAISVMVKTLSSLGNISISK
jgi:hypothetical protein